MHANNQEYNNSLDTDSWNRRSTWTEHSYTLRRDRSEESKKRRTDEEYRQPELLQSETSTLCKRAHLYTVEDRTPSRLYDGEAVLAALLEFMAATTQLH